MSSTYLITICAYFPRTAWLMMLIVKCKVLERQTEERRLPGILRKIVSLLSHKETRKKEVMPLLVSLFVKMFFLPGGAEISFLVTSSSRVFVLTALTYFSSTTTLLVSGTDCLVLSLC